MNTADLIVAALENEGVEYVFGIPGEENLHLIHALSNSEQIEFILTRHEQAAAFMAGPARWPINTPMRPMSPPRSSKCPSKAPSCTRKPLRRSSMS